MPVIQDVISFFDTFAPKELAEDWDNVGLLLGDRSAAVHSILTCLTLTPDVAEEAISIGAGLIVAHHPILFRAVKRITSDTSEGDMILRLARAGVSVFSPHTRYDSALGGINAQLASLLSLTNVAPLRPAASNGVPGTSTPSIGGGRVGELPAPMSLGGLLRLVKSRLNISNLPYVGDEGLQIVRVAIACGSAAEFLADAHQAGGQALITGEARFHACLEARDLGMALILPGHYATERPAMEMLAEILSTQFPGLKVAASQVERDPIRWI